MWRRFREGEARGRRLWFDGVVSWDALFGVEELFRVDCDVHWGCKGIEMHRLEMGLGHWVFG
jgi:hypothetical protein